MLNITTTFLYYTYTNVLYNSGLTETRKYEYTINDDDVIEYFIHLIIMTSLKEKEADKKTTQQKPIKIIL